jgi:hypothetical protein
MGRDMRTMDRGSTGHAIITDGELENPGLAPVFHPMAIRNGKLGVLLIA